ncbi:MAG TPA: NADH-ubiquinone oxidoreductase-F iron-sulfur binding region domain-containing protein [Candidatus Krumholzibacteria bacterium]|nr:NADH-ubiquinone oxidoreductase-F iron-sulfur binding region domain-containing protein [Candidatus Krumholzibacteria bacterium]HPD70188.1 NADH-ubiquinone oxidoreductase-F iron-sulfur binding region domain-containing protein [Candidatus Krumholzibacteria bacterium]HRY40112.1 NADH-ubiquinone oxidoreductase-F iron-sulfur binding region domain-containing protein [Candidatus Krumholzibacteria bacterium]
MDKTTILVGYASCGIAAGAREVRALLEAKVAENGAAAVVKQTGCLGVCYDEPIVEVHDAKGRWVYRKVNERKAERIFAEHVLGGRPVEGFLFHELSASGREPSHYVLKRQERIALANSGVIDPECIDDYLAKDGYQALRKVLTTMTRDEALQVVIDSGLRGRGGAGFPTGQKWSFCKKTPGTEKYLVCNADEGDPGAFMDRNLLEGDPHAVLEGMAIAAYVIGASHGYVYARAEYPLAIRRLRIAIDQMRQRGFLGEKILGTDFAFDIKLKEGAGAFVCGEETALFASIEGERGMPRIRPPFPAEAGLWGKPTNNNNVETYANVPWIIRHGAAAYRAFGTEKSAGTKVFSLAGKIERGGLVEVPMGIPLRDVIFDIGGGIPKKKAFKAVQMGGPSGGCLPASLLDTPVDYESITATGAIMGSGGMVVMDEHTCMVEVARFFLGFTQRESCGKCTFCRLGTLRMLEVLDRICEGEGRQGDIEELQELASQIKGASLCGLGQTAPNPVLTTLKYFREEYEAHIRDKRCPAGVCKPLITFHIKADDCSGCGACKKACPSDCITGAKGEPHEIALDDCIKCGSCRDVCPTGAVYTR